MPITRRAFLGHAALTLGALPFLPACQGPRSAGSRPPLRLGFLTDVHHAPRKTPTDARAYGDSPAKVADALNWMADLGGVDMLVQLGDLIDGSPDPDQDTRDLAAMAKQLAAPGWPVRHVVGNHCQASLTKAQWMAAVGQKETFGQTRAGPWTLIFLDACFTVDGRPHGGTVRAEWTESTVPRDQLDFLGRALGEAQGPVLVMVHQPVGGANFSYSVRNQGAVREVLTPHRDRISAVLQGHTHKNSLSWIGGIPYLTLRGLIEGAGTANASAAFALAHPDGALEIRGFRKQDGFDRRTPVAA